MNIYLQLIFILYLLVNIRTTIQSQAAQCPANELYYNVPSPMCDANCQNLQRRCPLTSIRPVAGCYCLPNYARNLQQRCIAQHECGGVLKIDCDCNELPIAPSLSRCEQICPTSPTDLLLSVCYHLQERQFCRNQRACNSNESPIAPLRRDCEQICPIFPSGLRVSICYHIRERRCVCSFQFCRNRRGQCVKY